MLQRQTLAPFAATHGGVGVQGALGRALGVTATGVRATATNSEPVARAATHGEVGVQGALERALGTALQEDRDTLRMTAAARTDAGVHAAGQARPRVWSGSLAVLGVPGLCFDHAVLRARQRTSWNVTGQCAPL